MIKARIDTTSLSVWLIVGLSSMLSGCFLFPHGGTVETPQRSERLEPQKLYMEHECLSGRSQVCVALAMFHLDYQLFADDAFPNDGDRVMHWLRVACDERNSFVGCYVMANIYFARWSWPPNRTFWPEVATLDSTWDHPASAVMRTKYTDEDAMRYLRKMCEDFDQRLFCFYLYDAIYGTDQKKRNDVPIFYLGVILSRCFVERDAVSCFIASRRLHKISHFFHVGYVYRDILIKRACDLGLDSVCRHFPDLSHHFNLRYRDCVSLRVKTSVCEDALPP